MNTNEQKSATKLKTTLGYALFVLSCLAWLVIPALPFLGLSGVQIATFTTGLLIFAEVLFWLSVVLLGRDIIDKVMKRF